eukprot:COSAG06_NODE_12331_length_1393_cov_4.877898_1_plen_49_part_10
MHRPAAGTGHTGSPVCIREEHIYTTALGLADQLYIAIMSISRWLPPPRA